jgi:hypothetical protein
MTVALNGLNGQVKLDPKLSAIVNEGKKKGDKRDKKKNKKNTYNHGNRRRRNPARKNHQRTVKSTRNKWASTLTTGANTTWHGPCTSPPTASWANSTSKIRGRSLRKPTPLPLLLLLRWQEETRLLCKMNPASHFFFFEKVEKNNDNKSVHSCCEETLQANFQSCFSFPVYFQELGQSKTEWFFFEIASTLHAIACNCSDIAEIACDLCNIAKITWQPGVESCTKRRIEWDDIQCMVLSISGGQFFPPKFHN